LRELVEGAIASHAIGAVLGNEEMPRDVERRGLPWRERLGQVDLHHRAFDARFERGLRGRARARGDLVEVLDDVAALEAAGAEARLLREDERVERLVLEGVLLHLHPDEAEGVGRVVGVAESELASERGLRGVERCLEVVVSAVLPVFGAGRA